MQPKTATTFLLLISIIITQIYCDLNITENSHSENAKSENDLENRLVQGITRYMNGEETEDLKVAIEELNSDVGFRIFGGGFKSSISCTLCFVIARILVNYQKLGNSKKSVGDGIKKLCIDSKLQPAIVCNGIVDLNIDIFVYIIENKSDLSTTKICNIIGQPFGCLKPLDDIEWRVKIPRRSRNTRKRRKNRRQKKFNVKILHFTDLHYDDLYVPGANALCGEPLCCGQNQGSPSDPKAQAGFWGDYRNCDPPWHSILDLMGQISKHKLDYVYYTGDIIHHRVWETSVERNAANLRKVYALLRRTFPKTPVFPILGNHEPNPLNEFAENITQNNLSTQWLYDLAAQEWSHWLPNSTMATIRKGGYYTVLVRPGFRIIALNSNVCYTYNWWLLYDDRDPYDQLQWLTNTLHEAEESDELVHILTHIPSGDDTCYQPWSQQFNRIINRFAHIIPAQFCGHTHFSDLQLAYDKYNKNKLISITFNGGSFTTFTDVNPNYRIYDVNPNTWMVEDYSEWIYNMTEANLYGDQVLPRWYKMYSFRKLFGVPKMSLKNMRIFAKKLATNQQLLDTFYRARVRDGDASLQKGCDQECHEKYLCQMLTSEFGDDEVCNTHVASYKDYLTFDATKSEAVPITKYIQQFFSSIFNSLLSFL